MVFEEKTLDTEEIYDGVIVKLRRDKVTVKNGTSYREIVEHSGGAVIAAFTGEGKIILVRQFRKPVERAVLEVPAGKIDPGEDPKTAAIRELEEETGYRAVDMDLMTCMYPSVGFTDEKLYIYYADKLEKGEPHPDENEVLDILEMNFDELYKDVIEGKIEDAKTIIAVLMSRERRRK